MSTEAGPTQIVAHDITNDDGDAFTCYALWSVPSDWSFGDLEAWAHEQFPARRCQHSHDCCGHYYPRKAHVTVVSGENTTDKAVVMIRQHYVTNI